MKLQPLFGQSPPRYNTNINIDIIYVYIVTDTHRTDFSYVNTVSIFFDI